METSRTTGYPVSISGMLKKLGVSRSGFHAFCNHKPSTSGQRKDAVKAQIRKIYDGSKQNYGAPKITRELQKQGFRITERTVGKYMRESGLRAQWVNPWIKTTKDSDFNTQLHNILDERFNPGRPNAAWYTDITYIWTLDGFVYLTSVMDLYSRKIIVWTLSKTMDVSCVVDTINKANARRETMLPLILHSDRGSQYVSQAYRDAACRFQLSYSHKGYPYDNACIESFHSLRQSQSDDADFAYFCLHESQKLALWKSRGTPGSSRSTVFLHEIRRLSLNPRRRFIYGLSQRQISHWLFCFSEILF